VHPLLAMRASSLPFEPSPHPYAPPILAENASVEIHLTFTYATSTYIFNGGIKRKNES
jgi:hypothetical protein